LLLIYFFSAVTAVSNKSTTFDELFHLTGGYSYWLYGDFRLQPENGNLPQRWAALPLLFSDTKFPSIDQDTWRASSMADVGEQFFYHVGNDADAILFQGRTMIAMLGTALGALVFAWTRRLMGAMAGLVSLMLYAFCPTVLTNGALTTSDMAAALFFMASLGCVWRVLHRVSWQTVVGSSLVMGLLFVSKFSAPMIVPMGLLLMACQLASRQPTVLAWRGRQTPIIKRRWRLPVQLATIAVHGVIVWCVIWTFYNFRYEMFANTTRQVNAEGKEVVVDRPSISWDGVNGLLKDGAIDHAVQAMRDTHFLPEAYLYGFMHSWQRAQMRSAFLNGEYSTRGWPQFFPICLMLKTPLTLFVLMGLAVAALARTWLTPIGWRARVKAVLDSQYRVAPLWSLFLVYWAFAIPSHLNIGHRHILPTYPEMLMLAGASTLWLARRQSTTVQSNFAAQDYASASSKVSRKPSWLEGWKHPGFASVVAVCCGLFAIESLSTWPNYLSYFNQLTMRPRIDRASDLIGGPRFAYYHLVDSSLDWGQDLPALKQWLVAEGLDSSTAQKSYLSYFGTGNPQYYRIQAKLLPCFGERSPPHIPERLDEGFYCISATMLQCIYTSFPGPWTRQYESFYQQLVNDLRKFDATANNPQARQQLVASDPVGWGRVFHFYEHARLARLCSFLRDPNNRPYHSINDSILVYRLSREDLTRALEGPPVEQADTPAP
jgi:4-amino-4-deoxy-L-arabinose transferase-like glycosyltransferase